MSNRREIILLGILFLFFFQLISEFVEAIYAFGLLGTGIPAEIACVLFLFSPILLLLLPWRLSGRGLALVGILGLAASVNGMFLDTRGRLLVTGFGTACFLVYFPALLEERAQTGDRRAAGNLGIGLALALALFILFRPWNSGLYPYDLLWFRIVAAALGVVGALLLLPQPASENHSPANGGRKDPPAGGFWKAVAFSVGLIAALTSLYFAFSSPNVIARWTGENYLLVLGLTLAALGWFTAAVQIPALVRFLFKPLNLALWNISFIIVTAAAILPHQVRFPQNPEAFPLPEPAAGPLAFPALVLMVLLFPVILADFTLFVDEILALRPGQRTLGAAFGLGALFLLVMIFGQVFTTVYDYIPVAGPLFRDRFWLIFLILGLAMGLLLILVKRDRSAPPIDASKGFPVLVIVLGLAAFLGAFVSGSRPASPPEGQDTLRVFTYNIQQGYAKDGSRNPDRQLALMQRINADLIGLQESDTNRIAGGNADLVRYFADRLDMYAYYGPKVVPGTFGIALLSKYPIEAPRTFYMFSAGEQTAAIHAWVTVGGQRFNVFVTHLGNDGPIVQQEAFLKEVEGLENVVAMGDFNFEPGGPQYALTTTQLQDAWLAKWPDGTDDHGYDPGHRIDHIFLSPGIDVLEAGYLNESTSDHPAFFVELEGWSQLQ